MRGYSVTISISLTLQKKVISYTDKKLYWTAVLQMITLWKSSILKYFKCITDYRQMHSDSQHFRANWNTDMVFRMTISLLIHSFLPVGLSNTSYCIKIYQDSQSYNFYCIKAKEKKGQYFARAFTVLCLLALYIFLFYTHFYLVVVIELWLYYCPLKWSTRPIIQY